MSKDSERDPLIVWENGVKNETAILRVQRPVYQTEELNELTTYEYPSTNISGVFKKNYCLFRPKECFYNTVPILKWLPGYEFKKNFMGDVFSGITVATMHIPHGLAYGILGNLPPIVGIYMGFFPVLIYTIFGTSRHVSIGTFAIVCLMTGKTVLEYSSDEGTAVNYTPIQVATTVTFTVSVIQMIMYLFRLGIITTLLSETLVNALTCASAFHVVTTQFKDLLGLTLPRRNGLFRILYTFYDVGNLISEANVPTVVISLIFVTVIALNNEILKPILARRTKIPFPIELVAIVTGTTISYCMDIHKNYAVNIIGTVPTGLPNPDLPSFSLIPSVLLDSFIIAMVSYTVTMSLALIVAQKQHYEVNSNQELFALSCSNCFGSFFSCMPVTASLSRTMIQQGVGGATQIASTVSCSILLLVLLWIGPLFENLPRCVLASVIVVSLKSMILQFLSLKKYWTLSKWDGTVWIITFFTTIIVDIDYGLLSGVIVSLVSIFVQDQKCYTCVLGVVPNTDLYLDMELYKGAQELPGIKIFHYSGPLNFASRSVFKKNLFKKTGFDPLSLYVKTKLFTKDEVYCRCVILDFTALTYVDPSGVQILKSLDGDYRHVGVDMYICGCSSPVFEKLKKCQMYYGKNGNFTIFPTVHDAVLYSQSVANTTT
ncbi:hypothetical protein RN001_010707 [Aquatica leii]|uniref:STAS domain-containing protein n=1 Tax=Aquatica leii TaxID=1421715 RepID=A0AAN7PA25_9COLE|nr:hypothetical protein RN001_010707 [Aquatica leii]